RCVATPGGNGDRVRGLGTHRTTFAFLWHCGPCHMTKEKTRVRLKTRVLGSLSALAVAGGLLGGAMAPAAHADTVGTCSGATALATATGITDAQSAQTVGVKLLKNVVDDASGPKGTTLGGSCSAVAAPFGPGIVL